MRRRCKFKMQIFEGSRQSNLPVFVVFAGFSHFRGIPLLWRATGWVRRLEAANLMRILLVADIHANWPALSALRETFDACLVLGDLVDYGLEPGHCIDWVRQNATYAVRGNHDHGVAQFVKVQGKTGFKYLTGVTREVTQERIATADRRFLAGLPISKRVTLDGVKFLLVHATPRDPLDEYSIADVDFWSCRLADVDAQVICVGHTHHPYVLEVGDKLVINPGSVGQPRNGDPPCLLRDHREPACRTQTRRVSGRGDRRDRPRKQSP